MKRIFFYCMLSILLAACSVDEADDLAKNTDMSVETQMNEFETCLYNYLTLSSKANKTRGDENFTMTPYVYEGDTVMYVVQYSEGWEVVSADTRYEMSIMKEDTGIFNVSELHPNIKGYFESIAEEIYELRDNSIEMPNDSSWNWLYPNIEDSATRTANEEKPDYSSGKWVLIRVVDKGTNVTNIPHIIKTKWNQTDPWNAYIPYDPSLTVHRYVGCVSVAVGQFAYFLHHKVGKPTFIPQGAGYKANDNTYIFYGNNSTINLDWDTMALDKYASSTKSASLLLGYIASVIGTDFKTSDWQNGSSANVEDAVIKYLNPQTGENYKVVNADYSTPSKIKSELNAGYPVLAGGRNNKDQGHRFFNRFLL